MILLAQDIVITTDGTENRIRAGLLAALGLVLIAVTVVLVWRGRKADPSETFSTVLAVLLGLIPGAIGTGVIALSLGGAVIGWLIPGVN